MLEEQVLRDKADFDIGAAVTTSALKNSDYKEVLTTHYNKITPEFEMKMSHVWESPDSYNWDAADALVEFARDQDMKVHGHTLIWYKGFPQWLIKKELDSVAFEKEVRQYITAIVSRYKGEIQSWDVVNEVFGDGGGMREENLLRSMFKDPVGFYGRCFGYAKEADPETLLFYNDYNVVLDSGKRKAIKDMVSRFQREGYPVDGLGDQFHYMVSTNKEQITSGFKDMASTGLLMHISELDIRVNVEQNDSYVFNDAEAKKQADTYHRIVKMYNELPDDQKIRHYHLGSK